MRNTVLDHHMYLRILLPKAMSQRVPTKLEVGGEATDNESRLPKANIISAVALCKECEEWSFGIFKPKL